jgi:hypothetical protein
MYNEEREPFKERSRHKNSMQYVVYTISNYTQKAKERE